MSGDWAVDQLVEQRKLYQITMRRLPAGANRQYYEGKLNANAAALAQLGADVRKLDSDIYLEVEARAL